MTQQHLVGHRSRILAHFVCQHTGHCCKSPGYVYVTSSDIDAMSKELQISTSQFIQHFVTRKNGWSLIATSDFRTNCFLDNKNKCTVYDARPAACRTYPDWDEIWTNDDVLLNESQQCKGLAVAIQALSL